MSDAIPIIIPFRDLSKNKERFNNLNNLLSHLYKYFKKHSKEFVVYIINQNDTKLFNKSTLLNIGIDIVNKEINTNYYILHDVDQIVKNDDFIYNNTQVSECLVYEQGDKIYKDSNYFGGVLKILKNDYFKINGFSNYFWGWGWEDGAIRERLLINKINYKRSNGIFAESFHETSHRYMGNINFINNAIIYFYINKTFDGYNNLKYLINDKIKYKNSNVLFYNISIQDYQYNVSSIITENELKLMAGDNIDVNLYYDILKTYHK